MRQHNVYYSQRTCFLPLLLLASRHVKVATGDVIAYEGLGLLDAEACPLSFEGKASPPPHSGHSSQARSSPPSTVSTK